MDASSPVRLDEAKQVLSGMLQEECVTGKPLLIFANKQDQEGALSEDEIRARLELDTLLGEHRHHGRVVGHIIHVQALSLNMYNLMATESVQITLRMRCVCVHVRVCMCVCVHVLVLFLPSPLVLSFLLHFSSPSLPFVPSPLSPLLSPISPLLFLHSPAPLLLPPPLFTGRVHRSV